jgi:undecaprenyl-diphosphatase
MLNDGLKDIFVRARPEGARAGGYSFPSGHSMSSALAYGMLIYVLALESARGWQRRVSTGLLLLLIITIGFSRMFLGVHYLSDVLAGFAMGGAMVAVSVTISETLRCRPAVAQYAKSQSP